MSYAQQIEELAKVIQSKAADIRQLEEAHKNWTNPKSQQTFWLGAHIGIFRADGTVHPALAGVQRAAAACIEDQLFKRNSELEGLRFRMVQLGRSA
jgi:hypothetical protein